ncbi:hypothetical protein TTHERM_000724732 (macronuclear) [Tetrahymena thermophila SB210]|uniref:Uncharacterized protein n=1 Tax=Tetrahymena thermophila (strain SB210) TaxID=312017 RepID=W7XE59_TETTS|nr:hypothetical protein TTHERM_000724732 [Tetrahymena thermophila SB210]EWS71154.1 hypothetical protein TTHERM_000724732 [Tetrahymena thermophila SB210]|eukprot:XP_012656295.1 hypothetical protein TTHERM_000724732 [Tetrahymena thermophila SB210]
MLMKNLHTNQNQKRQDFEVRLNLIQLQYYSYFKRRCLLMFTARYSCLKMKQFHNYGCWMFHHFQEIKLCYQLFIATSSQVKSKTLQQDFRNSPFQNFMVRIKDYKAQNTMCLLLYVYFLESLDSSTQNNLLVLYFQNQKILHQSFVSFLLLFIYYPKLLRSLLQDDLYHFQISIFQLHLSIQVDC